MWPSLGSGRFPLWPLSGEALLYMNVEFYWELFLHLLIWSYYFYSSIYWSYVVMWYISHWFIDTEKLLHLWHKCTWSWCRNLLMHCWTWFTRVLLRIFTSMFISDVGLQFSFLCDVFLWILYQSAVVLLQWIWKCSFLCNFFWIVWEG